MKRKTKFRGKDWDDGSFKVEVEAPVGWWRCYGPLPETVVAGDTFYLDEVEEIDMELGHSSFRPIYRKKR